MTLQQLRHITGTPLEALARQKVPAKPVTYMRLMFKNPLELAAGLDKDGECINALGAMESGSIEIGTMMPRPQPGSDKPRLFRLIDAEGLINRIGFNDHGVDSLVKDVKKSHFDGILGIDIGKNRNTPIKNGKDDYLICMERIYAYTGYVTINISSPNTPGLHTLQYSEALNNLLTAVKNRQNDFQAIRHKYAPVAIKVAPDLSVEELIQAADSLVCYSIDGVIATNTTFDRSLVQGMKNCDQMDGLSSRPLQLKSAGVIRQLLQELKGQLPVIGVGGIDSVIATREKIAAGATLVQIYSGFIFRGPSLIRGIVSNI